MNVINRLALREMIALHPDAAVALSSWWRIAKAARWSHLDECRGSVKSVDQVGRCVIFNIQGNSYRLITVMSWRSQRVYIKALLTHREYERNVWHKWAF